MDKPATPVRIGRRALGAACAVVATASAVAITVGAADASAAAPAPVPTVVVHMRAHHIVLSTGNRVHAGRVLYKVVTPKGDHVLQIARLHNGYTLQQAGSDLNKAFSGNVPAIRRIDRNVVFRGGAEARPNKPGMFAVSLTRGRYVFLDQNSNNVTLVNVFGRAPVRQTLPNQSVITTYTYGFVTSPLSLPHEGWALVRNKADQPHFIEFQHVKSSTTPAMIRRAAHSHGNPSFALPGSTSVGVLTQGQHEGFHYDLPPGKYLMACFWPDFRTGMPHFFMGMWKLVILR
jgi:hypothetical protein